MYNMGVKLLFAFIFAILNCISAEEVNFGHCDRLPTDKCKIDAVRINPCKEAPKPCKLRRGHPASISFDYTPQFDATNVKMGLYGIVSGIYSEFPGFNPEACNYTTCPLEAGKSAQLNFVLEVKKKFPKGSFPIKWNIWDESDTNNTCCFTTNIALR